MVKEDMSRAKRDTVKLLKPGNSGRIKQETRAIIARDTEIKTVNSTIESKMHITIGSGFNSIKLVIDRHAAKRLVAQISKNLEGEGFTHD